MARSVLNKVPWPSLEAQQHPETWLRKEWLVTNGLGGYASGSISGICTRRYHGLLVSALPAPLGRVLMFNHLAETLVFPDGGTVALTGEEHAGAPFALPAALQEFRLEGGLPVWTFSVRDVTLEKRLVLPFQQNTVHVTYTLTHAPAPLTLQLRPRIHIRPHDAHVDVELGTPYVVQMVERRCEVRASGDLPALKLTMHANTAALTLDGGSTGEFFYRVEHARGYPSRGPVWSPGFFHVTLREHESATLVASTESWESMTELTPREVFDAEMVRREKLLARADPRARSGLAAELVLAADQFIITPSTRPTDAARAHAAGDEVRTVIAGYPWFTDWGRDTMISLEGLTLVTGRHREAGCILRTFRQYVKDGLIPNMFPEGGKEGLYHTADASLWYFHAMDRYVRCTGDVGTLEYCLPALLSVVEHHLRGTRFGIGVDPQDGLLRQGAEGYQLTWMDAKVDHWVVTPRRGKAVEINALWYNALRLMERWLKDLGDPARSVEMGEHAQRCQESFQARFWYAPGGHLYDVVDGEGGDDSACRPNQVLAISLPHPVLAQERWESVLQVVRRELLTPVGLRSLSPHHVDYKSRYDGDLRARDAAYHQGTVWGWLAGPFVDAWLKVHPQDRAGAAHFLSGFAPHMADACIGTISEIFDAEDPFTPRGCTAQAWSVAEVLRALVKVAPSGNP
ncbi:MAG: amylo-alpha-1,6-glucosidase [Myxococcota bacterium]